METACYCDDRSVMNENDGGCRNFHIILHTVLYQRDRLKCSLLCQDLDLTPRSLIELFLLFMVTTLACTDKERLRHAGCATIRSHENSLRRLQEPLEDAEDVTPS